MKVCTAIYRIFVYLFSAYLRTSCTDFDDTFTARQLMLKGGVRLLLLFLKNKELFYVIFLADKSRAIAIYIYI